MSPLFNAAELPPVEQAARHEYEYWGSTLTTNTALKIALLISFAVIAILSFNTVRIAREAANVKPLVVRINDVGRADVVAYQEFTYRPQAPEIRYFLTKFVTGYYARNHKTVARQYVDSLYFLDRPLFDAIDGRDRRTQWLPKFLMTSDDDVDVVVKNVVLEDLETQPYRARVDFTKVFSSVSGAETKKENWAAEFVFRFNPSVPNQLILHNPLGLAITYFREDQAFN